MYTVGDGITASWLVSKRNVCSLRSYIDWLVATNRWLPTRRLRCCTYIGCVSSNLYNDDRLKHLKSSANEHTNLLCSPNTWIIFSKKQLSFRSVLPKWVYQVPFRMLKKSAEKKLAEHKNTSLDKFSIRCSLVFLLVKTIASKQRKGLPTTEESLKPIKVIIPPVVEQLFCYGTNSKINTQLFINFCPAATVPGGPMRG